MKAKNILAALLMMTVGLQTAKAQKIVMVLTTTDNEVMEFDVMKIKDVSFRESSSVENDWVDLGLPSGTKWATCNIGASKPEEYGDYFAWGETSSKDYFDWGNYKWVNKTEPSWSQINKYTINDGQLEACWYDSNGKFIGDKKTELDTEDDAAVVILGGGWRMPSHGQMKELVDNCTRQWTTQNGVNGILVTGPNGKTIFLPAAGYRARFNLNDAGSYGGYWTSSLGEGYSTFGALCLNFNSSEWKVSMNARNCGFSVRPVRP